MEEVESSKVLPDTIRNWNDLLSLKDQGFIQFPCIPVNGLRREYAEVLTKYALQFLVIHEVGHLRHGHASMKSGLTGNCFIVEAFHGSTGNASPLISQVWEFDADALASATGTVHAASKNTQYWTRFLSQSDSASELAFYTWCFSVWSLFRLFGDIRPIGALTSLLYPPTRLRQWTNLSTAAAWAVEYLPKAEIDNLIKPVVESSVESERAFGLLCGIAPQASYLADVIGPEGAAHLRILLREWRDTVRPQLLLFARSELAKGQTDAAINGIKAYMTAYEAALLWTGQLRLNRQSRRVNQK